MSAQEATAGETTVGSLYRVWTVLRADLKPLIETSSDVPEEAFLPKLEAAWALEHLIASAKPENLEDVRLKALVVRHWMQDAATEHIVDELLNSLSGIPATA